MSMNKILWSLKLVSQAIFGAMLVITAANTQETPATREATATMPTARQLKPLANLYISERAKLTGVSLSNPEVMPVSPVASVNETPSALEPISSDNSDSDSNNPMTQVTSVSRLSDVQPTDWAFQALQSLVERYGIISGYPDGKFRGNRTLTRYEFAAGLNAALNRVNQLATAGTANSVRKEDLATLQKLQQEFAPELATLRSRVNALEARTAKIEAQQFSTTTTFHAQIIFAAAGVNGGKQAVSRNFIPSFDRTNNPNTQYRDSKGNLLFNDDGTPLATRQANAIYGIDDGENFGKPRDNNIIFSDRVRLEFDTSFTGKDQLFIRLQAQNTPELKHATGTNYGRLAFDGDNDNQFALGVLNYSFPIGKKIQVIITPQQELYEILEGIVAEVSPLLDDDNGAISKFGRFNPIFRLGGENVRGAAFTYTFNSDAKLTLVYAGAGASNNPQFGLFNDAYVAMAHLTLNPIDPLTLGLTYANSYSSDLSGDDNSTFDRETGSKLATNPFPSLTQSRAIVNSYGVELAYRFNPKVTLAGWAGYSLAQYLEASGDKAEIFNWAVELAFSNLGKQGNLLGIVVGQPPKVISNTYASNNTNFTQVIGGAEPDTSYHFEAFYRYAINDYIAITPGFIIITSPENNSQNDTLLIGVIRTSFTF